MEGHLLAGITAVMMRFYLSLYLFVTAVYLLTASGRLGLSDGFAMFNVSHSVAHEYSLSAEPCNPDLVAHPNHCVPGVDGRYYAGFGLVPSFLAVPALLLGEWIAALVHVNGLAVSKVSVSLFTVLFSSLACVVLAMWIVKLGYSRRTAVLAVCILGFASPFWHFSVKGFYSEPYVTVALLLAAYLLCSPRSPLDVGLAGLAFGAACGCRVNAVILFPAFILYLAFQIRSRALTATQFFREAGLFTMSFSLCAFLIALANYVRFGSPLKTGYHLAYPSASSLLATPLFRGVYELLFSGEVGLLVFAPWVILALICFPSFVRAHRPESVLCGTLFLFNFLFFAKYDSWHGGWVAGPRFLTPTLPFLIIVMLPYIEKLRHPEGQGHRSWTVLRPVTMTLLLAGALVQALGVIFPEERYYSLMAFYGDSRPKSWWAGSIPFASIDFFPRVVFTDTLPVGKSESANQDQVTIPDEEAKAWPAKNTATTEEDFLRSFPNSENLVLPNLMLFKIRLLGLPSSIVYVYGISLAFVGLIGLIGLKRYV